VKPALFAGLFNPILSSKKFASLLFFSGKVKSAKISRPIEYSHEQGCLLDEAADRMSPNIYIQESVSFPVSIIDNRMVKPCTSSCKFLAFGVF
jgi:hypothetical protein